MGIGMGMDMDMDMGMGMGMGMDMDMDMDMDHGSTATLKVTSHCTRRSKALKALLSSPSSLASRPGSLS